MAKTNKGRKLFATTATAALVASAIVPVASAAQINDFNTISSYAQEAVQDLVDRGVIQGDEKGNFNPRKSVTRAEAATILVNALELESTGSINFTDVKAGAWYYDAINAAVNNGIFQGQGAGKFNPSGNLTRSEAAIILVDAFGLEGSASLSQFSDSASVKAWAQEALEIAVANGVIKGDNGKLNPNAPITRQDFAVMYSRTEGVEAPVSGAIKAINNTTVEVTFEEPVTDLASLDFKIEGLEITGKVVKQTDNTTVVLTTAAQTAGTTYTLSLDGEEVGKFTGVASVIPTAVKTVVASQQGVIGKEVTLTAEVTVAEGQSKAGIPVTFNIVNDKSTNAKIEVEALTNDKGVATYSYTRYYNGIDEVVAYATSKSSVKDNARVYWANAAQLTIKEAKEGNTVANNSKKVYEITGEKNSVVFVAFEENLNVKSNKVVDVAVTSAAGYIDEKDDYYAYKSTKDLTPYELSTGDAQYVVIELDSKGKGSLIITGEDASVTPIVYKAEAGKLNTKKLDENQEDVSGLDVAYSKLLLQDKAATVKFDKNDTLQLEVKALGTEDAAQVQAETLPANGTAVKDIDNGLGGRKYEVTVKNKAGEVAAAGTTAYVKFAEFEGTVKAIINGKVVDIDSKKVYPITVEGKEGKASFRVIGQGKKAYVTPTVFLNTDGKTGADTDLGKKDIQVEAETTYFTAATVKEAVIKVVNAATGGSEVTSLQAGKKAYAVYQSVDQNGFPYGTGKKYDVTFELTTTFGELKVDEKGTEQVQNVGKTYTYETTSDEKGRAVVSFTADSATTVEIDILGSRNVLPAKAATVKFTQFATGEVTGTVAAFDTDDKTLTVGTSVYDYADAKEYQEKGSKITRSAFETLLKENSYVKVAITKDADGNLTYNILDYANVTGPVIAGKVTDAVLSADGTKLTLTFDKNVVASTVATGDFTLTAPGTVASVASASEKTVVLNVTGAIVAGTTTLDVAADSIQFTDGTTNAVQTGIAIDQPAVIKITTLSETTPSVLTVAQKDAKGSVTIGTKTVNAAVASTNLNQADYNKVTVVLEQVAGLTAADPTATYNNITKTVTVKISENAATVNDLTTVEAAIAALPNHGTIDFGEISLAGDNLSFADVATPVTITLDGGVTGTTATPGVYAFTISNNLVVGDVVKLNGKSYKAGTDFVVGSTVTATATNLVAAIKAADARFNDAGTTNVAGVITLTEATATGLAKPTLTLN